MKKAELKDLATQLETDEEFARKGNKPQAPVLYQVALVVYRLAHVVEQSVLASIFKCSSEMNHSPEPCKLLEKLTMKPAQSLIGLIEY